MNNLGDKIKKSGIIETIFQILSFSFQRFFSLCKIFFLRLRNYDIDFSVSLGCNATLFQSESHHIKIGKKTEIGFGVRIKAGFDGRITVGEKVLIDDYSYISGQNSIEIGDNTMIASHVYIVDFNHIYPLSQSKENIGKKNGYTTKPVRIGKNVWIGTQSVILPGVTIGDNAVIGAGSIVTKSVEKNTLVAGNPAVRIK